MMGSPEEFYEYQLKGKTEAQILTKIRSLKREIKRLIRILEHPDYVCEICPSEDVQLICCREYLSVAKRTLEKVGGTYIPAKAELKAAEFEKNIPYISRIDFSVGGFTMGYEKRVVEISNGQLQFYAEKFPMGDGLEEMDVDISTGNFFDCIRDLHLNEWRRHYDLFRYGMAVMDGVQWELKVRFSNGHKAITYHGDNAYPHNFIKLLELLDLELDEGFQECPEGNEN